MMATEECWDLGLVVVLRLEGWDHRMIMYINAAASFDDTKSLLNINR